MKMNLALLLLLVNQTLKQTYENFNMNHLQAATLQFPNRNLQIINEKSIDNQFIRNFHRLGFLITIHKSDSQTAKVKQNIFYIFQNDDQLIKSALSWKNYQTALIVLTNRHKSVVGLFQLLWEQAKLMNVIIFDSNGNFHSWSSYTKHCFKANSIQNRLLPMELPNNLNGCPLEVSTTEILPYASFDPATNELTDGIEVRIVREFAAKYNLKLRFVPLQPNELFHFTIGPLKGGARLLHERKVDFIFGALPLTLQYAAFGQFIFPYTKDELLWFVPQPQRLSPAYNLYLAFSPSMWIAVLFVFLLTTLTLIVIERRMDCILTTVPVALYNVTKLPKTKIAQILILLFFVYSLHIITAYQSSWMSFITKPIIEAPIKSVRESLDRNNIPYMYSSIVPFFNVIYFPEKDRILTGYHCIRDRMHFETMDLSNKMVLGVGEITFFHLSKAKKFTQDGELQVRSLKPRLFVLYFSFFFTKGHPLIEIMEKTTHQLLESGIKKQWEEEIYKTSYFDIELDQKQRTLDVNSLIGAVFIYALLTTISVAIFLIEIMYGRLRIKLKRCF